MASSQQLHTLRVYHAPAGWVAQLWASVSCFLMLGGKARWEYIKGQNWLRAKLGQGAPLWAAFACCVGPARSYLLAAGVMRGSDCLRRSTLSLGPRQPPPAGVLLGGLLL